MRLTRADRGDGCTNALWGRGGRAGAAVAVLVVAACSLASTATAGTTAGHASWAFTTHALGRMPLQVVLVGPDGAERGRLARAAG